MASSPGRGDAPIARFGRAYPSCAAELEAGPNVAALRMPSPEIDTFRKGPVCNGSVAVNSIQEQFFAFFLRPDADDMVMLAEYARRAPGSADPARRVGKRCDPRRNSGLPAPRTWCRFQATPRSGELATSSRGAGRSVLCRCPRGQSCSLVRRSARSLCRAVIRCAVRLARAMYLRFARRPKDGKEHRYWSIVESRRCAGGGVVQRPVLYLGEINEVSTRRGAGCSKPSTRAAGGIASFPCSPPSGRCPTTPKALVCRCGSTR
jgi:Fatty acid cis/trans isomerase (CTI)